MPNRLRICQALFFLEDFPCKMNSMDSIKEEGRESPNPFAGNRATTGQEVRVLYESCFPLRKGGCSFVAKEPVSSWVGSLCQPSSRL
jgi:hypothetical protein